MPHTVFLVIPYRLFFPFSKPVRLAFFLLVVVLLVAPGSRATDFTFAQITDIHLSSAQTEADLKSTLKALANLGEPVDFILVTGDISEMGRPEEFQRCKSLLDSSGFRYYVLLGNHDVRWSTYSLEELAGLLPGVPHFAFMHKGVQFIGLNTALPLEAWGDLSPAEQRWLAEQMAAVPRNVPRLIFTHHPVFYPDRDFTADAFRFLKILNGYNVRLVSAGHGHRYRRWFLNDVPFVMAPAVLHFRGFLLFRVHGDSLLCEARLADSDSLLGGFRLALSPKAKQAAPPFAGVRVSTSSDSLWLRNLTDFDTVLVRLDAGSWQRTPVRKASVVLSLPVKVEGEHSLSLRLLTAADNLWQREFRFPVGKSLLWKLALNARV
ncbi:MAG: hypothetical protein GXO73_11890, partial [Calditrichaeota bacterium]|nr:hypothetical protein [Calditrichota bacterium]